MINCIRYVIANSLLCRFKGENVVDELARRSTKVDHYNSRVNSATTTFVPRNDTGFIT